MSKQIMHVLDEWGLSGKDIISILSLPGKTRIRHLDRYREGEALPDDEEIKLRIEHIIGIADALRTSFPRKANMGKIWMHTPHRRFNHETPVSVLSSQGLSGLRSIRAELDCAFAWDDTKSF